MVTTGQIEPVPHRCRRGQRLIGFGELLLEKRAPSLGEGQGGDLEANFERWLSQINGPEGGPVEGKRGKVEANGLVIHTLDASGTYLAGMPGQEKTAKPDQRLLGAVVEGAGGPYFLKLVGPKDAVAKQEKAYQTFLRQGLTASK